jgi:hypothetical protein
MSGFDAMVMEKNLKASIYNIWLFFTAGTRVPDFDILSQLAALIDSRDGAGLVALARDLLSRILRYRAALVPFEFLNLTKRPRLSTRSFSRAAETRPTLRYPVLVGRAHRFARRGRARRFGATSCRASCATAQRSEPSSLGF